MKFIAIASIFLSLNAFGAYKCTFDQNEGIDNEGNNVNEIVSENVLVNIDEKIQWFSTNDPKLFIGAIISRSKISEWRGHSFMHVFWGFSREETLQSSASGGRSLSGSFQNGAKKILLGSGSLSIVNPFFGTSRNAFCQLTN